MVFGEGCAAPVLPPSLRIAHVAAAAPFASGASRGDSMSRENQGNGPAPTQHMLRLHLWAIAQLQPRISAFFGVIAHDKSRQEVANYTDIDGVASLLPPTTKVRVLRAPNNTLGSYGMSLYVFEVTRGEYDYYICTEVDYMPVRTRYDALLVDIHRSFFGHKPGALMGFLQGRPAEPHSHYALHGQNEFVLSLAALDRLYEYLFGEVG